MNVVFQEFVTQAVREALGVSERTFRSDKNLSDKHTKLDQQGQVKLEPDLTWWEGDTCVFVGDAKYKKVTGESVPNADLYQMLAYTTALDLSGGLLIYAEGESEATTHTVRHSCKQLETTSLDLSGALEEILASVREMAGKILELRDKARGLRVAGESAAAA